MCAVAAIAGDFKDLLAPDKAKALPLPEARWRRSDGRADVERCLSGCMRVPQYREAGNGPCSLLTTTRYTQVSTALIGRIASLSTIQILRYFHQTERGAPCAPLLKLPTYSAATADYRLRASFSA